MNTRAEINRQFLQGVADKLEKGLISSREVGIAKSNLLRHCGVCELGGALNMCAAGVFRYAHLIGEYCDHAEGEVLNVDDAVAYMESNLSKMLGLVS